MLSFHIIAPCYKTSFYASLIIPFLQVLKLMKKRGTSLVLIDSAGAGDIISMAGLTSPSIGHTVASVEVSESIYYLQFASSHN